MIFHKKEMELVARPEEVLQRLHTFPLVVSILQESLEMPEKLSLLPFADVTSGIHLGSALIATVEQVSSLTHFFYSSLSIFFS